MADPPIYLDNHATTRPDPRVLEAMWPYFSEHYGNAASIGHRFGWDAADAVDAAREEVAALLAAQAREIVFTSGATEANNLALKGVLPGLRSRGNRVVTTSIEHKSVLDVLRGLARSGWEVAIVPPDHDGVVSAESIASALDERTVLVSVMAANNEVGTINPLAEIGQLCQRRGVVFHSDATQAVGKIPFDVRASRVDLLSLSGHKLHGPKGIGALYVRRGGGRDVRLAPLLEGGGHERGLRSGTVPVPLVVGFGEACKLARLGGQEEAERLRKLRDRLHDAIVGKLDGVVLNGHPSRRLPGNLNLSFGGVDGEALMMRLTGVAVSSGAACTSVNPEPSHVLTALGRDERSARASLRFGVGRFNTADEIDRAAELVVAAVLALRGREVERAEAGI